MLVTAKTKAMGKNRSEIILAICAADNTFELHTPGHNNLFEEPVWFGKCIHCGTRFAVNATTGSTMATVEHIRPLCVGGDPVDPRNLALACATCNNEKGVRHDVHAGKGHRADEVIMALEHKRQ